MAETVLQGSRAGGGLLDLEKELTCSICTEVLYQPLTLLDCLHTFCGSCSKLWFAWQASHTPSLDSNPYTCPSCRATVRGTRPDAKINTLLDMFLQANPSKAKPSEEKEEIKEKYTPGDNVTPETSASRSNEVDARDRRMVEEVREMSLRDTERRGNRGYERGARHDNRSRESRNTPGRVERHRSNEESRSQARQIEHQSSLRSLISSSDVDSAEMEEEILRQIMEEGLLDGIDLNNLDLSQEDELSERIADAYRRRHMQGRRTVQESPRTADSRRTESAGTARQPERQSDRRATSRQHSRSTSAVGSQSTGGAQGSSAHPPVSRPHLLEAHSTAQSSHRRRTSSESRRQTTPLPASSRNARREAARSATDLSNRPSSSNPRERRISDLGEAPGRPGERRARRLSEGARRVDTSTTLAGTSRPTLGSRRSSPSRSNLTPSAASQPPSSLPSGTSPSRSPRSATFSNTESPRPTPTAVRDVDSQQPSSSSSPRSRPRATLFPEPAVTCDGCGKTDIQHNLHENCVTCKDGNYNLCHNCFRSGKGCLHWFGFGHRAWHRFQTHAVADQDLPHTLIGRKYLRPKPETVQRGPGENRQTLTTENPATRLQTGAFCSICHEFADECFWRCDYCNEGEWGYCEKCVNQGKCCPHPLLPLAHVTAAKTRPSISTTPNISHSEAFFAPVTSPTMVQAYPPANFSNSGKYRPLTFITHCDICKYSVQPSQSRYHCYQCNDGNYDICSPCYAKLGDSGRISREHGDKGWRRCPRGHRMIIFYFEDSPSGQSRIIVNDLVGGHFLEDQFGLGKWKWDDGGGGKFRTISRRYFDDDSSAAPANVPMLAKYPPDGGIGMQVVADHPYLPTEDSPDELSFPRGAEIREVNEISDEWYMGFYAGSKGLFPANHVKVIQVITM